MVIQGLQHIRDDHTWRPDAHHHEDLWQVLSTAVRAKPYLRWEKVKGHRALSDCATDRDRRTRQYNNAADELAVAAAQNNQPPPQPLLADAKYWTNILPRLQHMAITILLQRQHLLRDVTDATILESYPPTDTNDTNSRPTNADTIRHLTTTPLAQLFPHYPWRLPPPLSTDATPPTPRYTPSPIHPRRQWWRYDNIHFHALQWYLSRLLWPTTPTPDLGCTWVELLLDYEATTHQRVRVVKDTGPTNLEQKARAFAGMVRCLTKRTRQPLATTYEHRTSILRTLGYTTNVYKGLPDRPHLLRPAQVGRWLAEHAAKHRLQGRPPTLKGVLPDTRNPGPPLWRLSNPSGYNRRLRVKTTVVAEAADQRQLRIRRGAIVSLQ